MPDFPTTWFGGGSETSCGAGSMLKNMRTVIEEVPKLLAEWKPDLIIELGCGDLNFAKHAIFPSGIQYRGFDIKSHPTWENYDCTQANILEVRQFSADVIVARDVFIHLPNEMILQVLSKLRYKYLLTTTYPGVNNRVRKKDPSAGFSALDLTKGPFNLPKPLKLIQEHSKGKFLGVFNA